MVDRPRFESAAVFTLAEVAAIFTRCFDGYYYPAALSAQRLAARARLEQLDFEHSVVMLLDDEPVGLALLALRDTAAWCGGFGIATASRGRGLARPLGEAMLEQARRAGATRFVLEVLTRNAPALKLYSGLGLAVEHDLQLLEWSAGDDGQSRRGPEHDACVARPPRELLQHFDRLHPGGAAWQRDLPALLVQAGLQGLAYSGDTGLLAYVLYSARASSARIEDLGAARAEDAIVLLRALQARFPGLGSTNEPADGPLSAAYLACGFREVDRQHQMAREL